VSTDKTISDLRIVFVSDLHLKEYGKNNEKLLSKIKELNPSIIAIGGDSVIYGVPGFDSAITFINEAAKIAPTYFALGNHEWSVIYTEKNTELLEALQNSGAVYLENDIIEVDVNGNSLVICGIIDSVYAKNDFSNSILEEFNNNKYNDKFKLLLSHRPVTISYTDVTPKSDLVLSGHEHGGQIVIPFTKQGLYSRNQGWFPKYTSGIHTIADNTVIISTGLSNSDVIVPRVNNRPELVVIDVN
jgi:predicted MPP superfamily phosphohydrolase